MTEMIFRLKELREKREMSQVRLGVELGINQDVISRYENLEREADYRTLLDIADFFDVSLDSRTSSSLRSMSNS